MTFQSINHAVSQTDVIIFPQMSGKNGLEKYSE
jgi:hypothetical protein